MATLKTCKYLCMNRVTGESTVQPFSTPEEAASDYVDYYGRTDLESLVVYELTGHEWMVMQGLVQVVKKK